MSVDIDRRKIGDAAAGVAKDAFRPIKEAMALIKTDDEGICIDGYIELYGSDKSMTKETLIGELPVQVKGKVSKPKPFDGPKYSVEVLDLKRFLDVFHGVLFIVVYLDKSLGVRGLYYVQLLPYDINKLLSELSHAGQKTKSVRLKRLPKDLNELRRLLHEFNSNRELQFATKGMEICSVEAWERQGVKFSEFKLSKTYFPGEKPFSLASLDNGAYIYGITADKHSFPVNKFENVCSLERAVERHISIGDIEDDVLISFVEDAKGEYLSFGGFTMRFDKECTWNYATQGDFRDRYRDARIMKALEDGEFLYIDGKKLCGGIRMSDDTANVIDEHLKSCKGFAELLEKLCVKIKMDPKDLSNRELYNLDRLRAAFVDGKHLSVDANGEKLVNLNLEIVKARIKAIGILQDDGLYELADPLDPDVKYVTACRVGEKEDDRALIPSTFLLSDEDFSKVANLDAGRFEESLNRIPVTSLTEDVIGSKLLDMLKVYDAGAVCGKDLLRICELTAKALCEVNPESDVHFINCQQVLKRLGSELDTVRLNQIAMNQSGTTAAACAHVLLGNIEFAKQCIANLNEEDRTDFGSWPICSLLDSEGGEQ